GGLEGAQGAAQISPEDLVELVQRFRRHQRRNGPLRIEPQILVAFLEEFFDFAYRQGVDDFSVPEHGPELRRVGDDTPDRVIRANDDVVESRNHQARIAKLPERLRRRLGLHARHVFQVVDMDENPLEAQIVEGDRCQLAQEVRPLDGKGMRAGVALGARVDSQAQAAGQAGAESVVASLEGEKELPRGLDGPVALNELTTVFDD